MSNMAVVGATDLRAWVPEYITSSLTELCVIGVLSLAVNKNP